MICQTCAAGADVKTYTVNPWVDTETELTLAQNVVEQMHALCKGGTWCDCQHVGTPVHRKPGSDR